MRSRRLLVALAACFMLVLPSVTAHASHGIYTDVSWAVDASESCFSCNPDVGHYMAASTTWDDLALVYTGSSCTVFRHASAHPVSQHTEIYFGGTGSAYLEMGVMNQCSSNRFNYSGRYYDGTWVTHRVEPWFLTTGGRSIVRRTDSNVWESIFNGSAWHNYTWNTIGLKVFAGLSASYLNFDLTILSHTYRGLQYKVNNNCCNWINYAGQEPGAVSGPQCGEYESNTTWEAARNSVCT